MTSNKIKMKAHSLISIIILLIFSRCTDMNTLPPKADKQDKILEIHGKRMIDSDFKPGFKLSLHHKDLKIAKSFLSNIGIQLKSLNQVKKLMHLAEREGLSDLDSSSIHSILEKTYK